MTSVQTPSLQTIPPPQHSGTQGRAPSSQGSPGRPQTGRSAVRRQIHEGGSGGIAAPEQRGGSPQKHSPSG